MSAQGRTAASVPDLATVLRDFAQHELDAEEFAASAQAARDFFEPRGYRVHVQTNQRRITITKEAKPRV